MSSEAYAARILEAKSGSIQALEELIQENQGLIRVLAGRLYCERESRKELIQAGNLGLIHAITHFDPSRDTKLITYAVPWILGEMRRALHRTEAYSLDQPLAEDGQTLYDILASSEHMDIRQLDLRLALARLNREEQIVVLLRYYRDRTQKETAALLGKSQAQISRLERRALDALRALLI